MNTVPAYRFDNVWEEKSQEFQQEMLDFWLTEGALPSREAALQRLPQVAMVARDNSGAIAAVCTVYQQYCERLENWFYYSRAFTGKHHRQAGLSTDIFCQVRDYFEQRFCAGVDTRCIGFFAEIESDILKQHINLGYRPSTKTVYIGKNERGDHLRVYYFPGARII